MDKHHAFQCQDDIRKEARAWVLRCNSDTPMAESDIAALREWSKRSAAHRAELQRAEAFWCDADDLSELAVPFARASRQAEPRSFSQFLSALLSFNRAGTVAAALFVGVAVVLSSWLLPLANTEGNGVYVTAIGEQKTLTLRDQSIVQLDTQSEVRVAYEDGVRRIHLLRGKVHFDVAKNPQRPFQVYARGGMVRAVGTAFSVYLREKAVEVIVDEGRVDLARLDNPPVQISLPGPEDKPNKRQDAKPQSDEVFMSLDKGQSASFDQAHQTFTELEDKELSKALAWRRGLLIFAGDTLEKVVSEVNRYTETRIEIADPEISNLVVGGRFKVGELEALFDVLEAGFGVQISYVSEKHVLLRSSSN